MPGVDTLNAADVLQAFALNFEGLQAGLMMLAAVIGIWLVALSVKNFATYRDLIRNGSSLSLPLTQGLTGAGLLGFARLMQIQTVTIFPTENVRSILDYQAPAGTEVQMLVTVLLGLMTFFGWIGILHGWIIWGNAGSQPASQRGSLFWNGAVFLLFGTLASNLEALAAVIAATFKTPNYLELLMNS